MPTAPSSPLAKEAAKEAAKEIKAKKKGTPDELGPGEVFSSMPPLEALTPLPTQPAAGRWRKVAAVTALAVPSPSGKSKGGGGLVGG